MSLAGFLIECSIKNIRVYLEDEKLKVEASGGALSEEEREYLKANKANIIGLFNKYSIRSNYNLAWLSRQQKRLWIIDQIEPGSTQYNLPAALKFDGELDQKALQQALSAVVERHQVLRTTYHADDREQAIQVIRHAAALPLPVIDVSHLAGEAQNREVSRVLEAEASTPFDLASDTLLRALLVKLSPRSHVLAVTMHHIAADGWSGGILTKELSALYGAFSTGLESPLPPLAIQYADYSHWQRGWLQGEVLQRQLEYWTGQLQNLPTVHNLPLDRPRPPVPGYRGGIVNQRLSADIRQGLNALAKSQGATLFMVLNAAFACLLSRYSGERDIVIGSPIANREKAELAPLVGFFINTLVLRSDLSGDPAFIDLLSQSKGRLLGAYEHQQLPFEILVDELQPARSLGHNPLFQVMLTLQNNEQEDLVLPGLTLSKMPQPGFIAKFDLTLEITEMDAQGLHLGWEYATDLFDAATIERMAEHFETLLRGIIANPATKTSRLPLLTPAERDRLLREWNDTGALYPKEHCMHELFEEQVARAAGSTAVLFNDQALSYGELNASANRLAHYLMACGVRTETLVGLNAERSLDMLIGVLGILKAGAAYVPLDPGYPAARLEYMLQDSGVEVVLSQAQLRPRMAFGDRRVVCLDDADFLAELNGYSAQNPERRVTGLTSRNLAYVIYTSGSTGKPKGVMIEHASLTNFLCAMREAPGISVADALLAVTSTSFDIHTLELYLPLISGARVVIACADDTVSPANLIDLIKRHGVSLMQATPSTWKMLLAEGWRVERPLKVLCGGEAWSAALKDELLRQGPVELWNMYGPTETTVWSSVKKIVPQDSDVHLGPAIANTQLYVLDENRELCPIGVPGELYIGGDGLARGYLNRPELTAERFITDPFSDRHSDRAGARMYRTGDLVRWRADGNLQFLGRIDQQVKIRGFRIELEEIENQLSKIAGVQSAVVVAREDEPGNKRLVAYITADKATGAGSDSDLINTLRTSLQAALPGYMVPSAFVLLDALPLTPNGKIDKKALPAPEGLLPAGEYVAPSTDAERTLVGIWSELLGIDAARLSVTANFFALGGDSLLAMQLVSRARQAGIVITLKQILSTQTLAELALADNTGMDVAGSAPVVGDVPLTVDQAVFLGYDYHMPHWGNIFNHYELTAALDVHLLEDAANALLAHHDALRARFIRKNGVWRQIIDEPRRHKIVSAVDLSHLDSETAEQRINDIAGELAGSFDLSTGPLVKIVLIDLGAGRPKRVLLSIHHLVCDGFSSQILMEDIVTAYQQLLENRSVRLPGKTTSVKDWIARLEEYADSDELKQEARYWRSLPWNDMPKLPIDFAGGESRRYEGSHIEIPSSLSEQDTLRIMNDLPRRYGVSAFDAISAALVAALSAWMRSDKVPLYVLDSGRNVLPDMRGIDLSRTVGWLSYPRLALLQKPRTEDVVDLLKSVSAQLKALPNQGSGFGMLSAYHRDNAVRERLRAIPVPQVWLNFIGVYTPPLPEISLDKTVAWTPPDGGEPRKIHMTWIHPDNQEAWYILLKNGIHNNRFHMHWRYSENLYRRETIEALADNYLAVLRAIAALPM